MSSVDSAANTISSSETVEPSSPGRRHPLAKCEVCPLNDSNNVFVPSGGNRNGSISIVGEAPGFQEAKKGVPFTGPSGKLLDLVLTEHGVDKEEVFLTNVCLCRPPGNATPGKTAISACASRLKAELNEVHSESIVALGNTAAQAILDTRTGITTLRTGPPRDSKLYPFARIIPTVHPAACLRSSDMFPMLVDDIGKLVRKDYDEWQEPVFRVFDDAERACVAMQEMRTRFDTVVVDIECGFEKDTDFDHPDQYQMLCVGFSYAPGKAIVIGEQACADPRVRQGLRDVLESCKLIAHNGKFDLAGLRRYGRGRLYFDTMLASYCVDERPGTHGLKYLATEILGAPQYDAEIHKYVKKGESYGLIPRDVLYRYNAYDVACTWGLYEYYSDRLAKEGLRELHDMLCLFSDGLQPLEVEGIKIDIPYLDVLTDEHIAEMEKIKANIHRIVGDFRDVKGEYMNPNSPKQVKEYFAEKSVRTDRESTDEEALRKLLDKGTETKFVEALLEWRREAKLYGTYIKGARKRLRKGRLHPTFLLHGTVTGRLACRNPNLQNVPRDSSIRRMFIPEEGNLFVQGDYAQAELRVMATLAEDEFLREVFNDGRDLHSEVAERFFGPGFTKEQRIRAKAVVFGLSYGREAYSLAEEFKIPVAEARRYLETFFDAIPSIVDWRHSIEESVMGSQDDLVSPFGRHRRFWLITDDNKKDVLKEAYAFLPQGTASDICLHALVRMRSYLPDACHIRLPVHDSILVECPEADAEEVGEIVQRVMEETACDLMGNYVKWSVDVAIGASWGDLK